MTVSTITTVRSLLESVLAGLDDPELQYRQRTALQLLDLLEDRAEFTEIAIVHADPGPAVGERLEPLGSLE